MLKLNRETIFKNKYLILLILVMLFAFSIRFYYLVKSSEQAVWWDAADYLSTAKYFAGQAPDAFEDFHMSYKRTFFLPFIWSLFFRLGASEFIINLTELLFSLAGIYLTYLIGKEMFDEKIGLIAAFLMSVFWSHLFWGLRFMMDIPSATFLLASFYFFWRGYVKKEKNLHLYLFGLFFGLAVFTKSSVFSAIIPFGLYILIKERLKIFRNKKLILTALIFLLVIAPFVIYVQLKTGDAIGKIVDINRFVNPSFAENGGRFSSLITHSVNMPMYLQLPFFALMLIGLLSFINLILGLDMAVKEENSHLNNLLLLFLWVFGIYFFFGVATGAEERHLMSLFPMLFILAAIGAVSCYRFLSKQFVNIKYASKFVLLVLAIIFILGSFLNLQYADSLIKSKYSSYYPVKEAGLYVKENSMPSDLIYTASYYQNLYYSERNTRGFPKNESDFDMELKENNPKFVIVSVFEPAFTPQWAYAYADKHKDLFTPVKAYFADQQQKQPLLVVYQYNLYK